jgi:hypothetical protein
MTKTWQSIRGLFLTLNGNALVMTLTSQLWVVPTAGLGIYQPVFFQAMGMSTAVYGLLMSVQQLLQILYNLPGAWFAAKLGKKWANIVADVVGWIVGPLLFTFANQRWELVVCLAVYNFWVVGNVAHQCLLVDETDSKQMMSLFTVRQWISSILPMIAVPIFSAIFMHRFGVIVGVRLQFAFLAVSVMAAIVIRMKMLHEPQVPVSFSQNNLFQKHVLKDLLVILNGNHNLRRSIAVSIAVQFALVMTDTYFSIFALTIRGVTLGELGLNAIVGGGVVWVSTFFLAQYARAREETLLLTGLVFRMLAWAPLFVFSNFYGFLLYMLLSNLGSSIIQPALTAWFANSTTENLRPTLYGVYNLISGTVLLGAPPLGGVLLSDLGLKGLSSAMVALLAVVATYLVFAIRSRSAPSLINHENSAADHHP